MIVPQINRYPSKEEMFMDFTKNGDGAELGVAKGCNAIRLLHLTKPKSLALVDLWSDDDGPRWDNGAEVAPPSCIHSEARDKINNYYEVVDRKFADRSNDGVVKLFRQDFTSWLNSQEDNSLDWIYLDGSHQYADTKNEITRSHRVVKPGGIIAGHDFQVNFVWGFGVICPVIEMINEGHLKMTGLAACDELISFPSFMCEVIK
jgi:SAM-dependent methyltransferase